MTYYGFGTTGDVLTSNGPGILPSFQAGGGGALTLNGDSGSASGSTIDLVTGQSTRNSGSTVLFNNSGTTSTLNVTDVLNNTIIGSLSGTLTATGGNNTILGYGCASNLDSAVNNVLIGTSCGPVCAFGLDNVAIGYNAAASLNSGYNSIAIGSGAGAFMDSADNIAIGKGSLNITYGSNNIALGSLAGSACTNSESNNILIGNIGASGVSDTTFIGTTQGACFIAGIDGVTITGAAVLCDSNGQLGDVVSSARFKDNIQDLPDSTSLLNLRPVSFNYKTNDKVVSYGMIAEEVEPLFPDLVLYKDNVPYSLKYHEMPALLLKEIQRLNARLLALEAKVNA